jgi:hypothetical protein
VKPSTFFVSDDVSFISEVHDKFFLWIDDSEKRDKAIEMLNEFDQRTFNRYWLTDEEELMIDSLEHLVEAYC